MKLIKVLTRRYSLLEHGLIDISLMKGNTSISEVYYYEAIDVSRKGLLDIYARKDDVDRIRKWIVDSASKDPKFIEILFKKGLEETEKFSKLPVEIIENFIKMNDGQIIKELLRLKKMLLEYGGYFDFTIHLGQCNVPMEEKLVNELGQFHEHRKKVFLSFFEFIKKYCSLIADAKKIEQGNLNSLYFDEIIQFLEGKISVEEVNKRQEERETRYVARITEKGCQVFVGDDFEIELEKIKEEIIDEEKEEISEIKGAAINKGIVRGEVRVINQLTKINEIPAGKIIVTEMTHPDVTLALKKSLAIVTDEGGLLCHAANIAREFGIISLIGTKIATKVLKDGDLVEVDANKGIVKIIKRN